MFICFSNVEMWNVWRMEECSILSRLLTQHHHSADTTGRLQNASDWGGRCRVGVRGGGGCSLAFMEVMCLDELDSNVLRVIVPS